MSTLIIGAGGVGAATTHKCAQHNDELGDLCLASRTVEKCERIVEEVRSKGNLKTPGQKLTTAQVDAMDTAAVAGLIRSTGARTVLNIPARRIEFWMGFGERYLTCFNVLKELGLLSNQPVDVEGVTVAPIKLVKAVLPEPSSLAPDYTGKVCIGCLIKGTKEGEGRELFIYTVCDHEHCFKDIGAQAISYTTAVPIVTAALLVTRGEWSVGRLVNVEELDPDPFMALMPEVGLSWNIRD